MPDNQLPIQDFNNLLIQYFGHELKIKHIEWKHLTDPGDNFGSLIFAVNVNITRDDHPETLRLVIKLPPNSKYLLDLFNSPLTFKKELCFYAEIVPALMNLQRECDFQEQDLSNLVPQYFGGRLGLKNSKQFDIQAAIILENLNYSGYSIKDRITGLDKEHLEFAIKELAKLHALIICLRTRRPEFFENVVLSAAVPTANDTAKQCVTDMIEKACRDLKNIKEAKPYLESIEKTLQHNDTENESSNKQDDIWMTLVHNDFWVNNMMFRYDESGHITNMKMVDFQLYFYDYGIKDLIFFLLSSAKKEIIDNCLDDMINFYYECFIGYLKLLKMNTEHYHKTNFLKLVNECAPLKFGQCIMMVQVIQATRGSTPKMENIENKDDFLSMPIDDVYKEKLLSVVLTFDKKKWLLK